MSLFPSAFGSTPTGSAFGPPAGTAFGFPSATTSSLFNTPAPAATGTSSLFPSSLTPSTTTSSLFPTATATAAPAAFSAFSSTPNTSTATSSSLFSPSPLFSGTTGSSFGTSLGGVGGLGGGLGTGGSAFGTTPGLLFQTGANTLAAQQQQQQQQQGVLAPQHAIEKVLQSYMPQSSFYRFSFVFYNQVDPSTVSRYERPPTMDERSWQQAQRDNPDPRRLIPVVANGFEDLKKRMVEQDKLAREHARLTGEMQAFLAGLEQRHEVEIETKFSEAKRRHLELQLRLLRVLRKLELLQARGTPLMAAEERWKAQLSALQRELNKPTQFRGRLQELMALVKVTEELHAAQQEQLSEQTLDEPNLEHIYKFLHEQQAGLLHLTTIARSDARAMQAVIEREEVSAANAPDGARATT